ncbi:hypothetical protein C1S99_10900 [Vibrio parahaemolyticus]|nr:hypothetical protein C1T12_11385 [Vibrio parahaemolyticus]PMS62277.1 hypothetical protein C1S91_15630 [Vibrio parahaemolyticus]PMS72979.1 hypothetical protein C1T10_14600 [Vibrio parahaemolyticus]PMS77983.1 hypothetical protein C1S88_14780 [Vibrio parahaemolyticus]PMS87450.1 hypothetical protein C1S94_07105 [Vibrio parahaemolyticus]
MNMPFTKNRSQCNAKLFAYTLMLNNNPFCHFLVSIIRNYIKPLLFCGLFKYLQNKLKGNIHAE